MHSVYFLENYILFAERFLLVLWKLFILILLCLVYGFFFNKGIHLEKFPKFRLVQAILADLGAPRLWAPDGVEEVPLNSTELGGVS